MKAVTLQQFQEPLEVTDVEKPDVTPDGAVVEMDSCGVCRSDWHAWQGDWDWLGLSPTPPHVLGHEPVGHVVEVGKNVENIEEGDHVGIPFNFACGNCHQCRNGRENICENLVIPGFVDGVQGAFAEELHVPTADINCIPLPDGIDSTDAAGLGCRYMTAYHGLAHRGEVGRGEDVVIHGLGGVGLSGVQIADALGANVIGVDLMEDKLEKAEELGAVATVNAREVSDPAEEVKDITDGGAAVSVDALGVADTCQNAVLSLGGNGRHVQIGLSTQEEEGMIPLPTDLVVSQEIDFLGSLGLQPSRYGEILDMMSTGKLDPGAIVSEEIDMHDVPDKIASMSDYETVGIPVCSSFS